jgi:3-hydroxybutyryl-CoA dehydratase
MSIAIGDRCERVFHVSDETIEHFGAASEDRNPVHFDDGYAAGTIFKGRIAHGILTASFISAVIGTELPGPGSIYLGQTLKFRAPVRPGDDVRVVVEVTDYDESRRGTVLDTRAFVGDTLVLEGEARVIAPAT